MSRAGRGVAVSLGLLVLVLTGCGARARSGAHGTSQIDSVIGLSGAQAARVLSADGLHAVLSWAPSNRPNGTVISVSRSKGTGRSESVEVTLARSVLLPDLRGVAARTAASKIRSLHLKLSPSRVDSNALAVAQVPPAGWVAPSTHVHLRLVTGRAKALFVLARRFATWAVPGLRLHGTTCVQINKGGAARCSGGAPGVAGGYRVSMLVRWTGRHIVPWAPPSALAAPRSAALAAVRSRRRANKLAHRHAGHVGHAPRSRKVAAAARVGHRRNRIRKGASVANT
jgi:hypothetical protein